MTMNKPPSGPDIHIRADKRQSTSPYNRKLSGTHYQLEPKFKMPVLSFQGALNNMARAAIVQQIAATKTKA
jgi:hypothetical protein